MYTDQSSIGHDMLVGRVQTQKVTTSSLSPGFVILVELTLKFKHEILKAVACKENIEMLPFYDDEK